MSGEQPSRASDLYHEALRRPFEERTAFIRDACGADVALRMEVESLLAYEPAAAGFLELPASVSILDQPPLNGSAAMMNRELGPYTIIGSLGAGGMGEVYRARDNKLGRDVAIKILPSQFTADPERHARFAREARLLATLSHPNIGAIYGVEETDGRTALVLELVEGPTLAERLERGPIPIGEALTVGRELTDAIDAAHENGIVHRDLKPANIILQQTKGAPRVKVLDFGLAKALAAKSEPLSVESFGGTAEGRVIGTPAYMSPEQARGLPVDKRTDIWSFGCVLYEMLSGIRAFRGDTKADTFARLLEREPDWKALPRRTPAAVRTVLERCLRKDAAKRLKDIGDARIELEEALARSWTRSRRSRIGAIAAALALIGLGTVLALWVAQRPVEPTRWLSPFRLTFEAGIQSNPTFSPDGRYIAYASNESGNFEIWMRPVAGGAAVAVTRHPANDSQPSCSPLDGRIAFRSERDGGGLFVVPPTGGNVKRLTNFGYRPQWSPDGSQILFVESAVGAGRLYTVALDDKPPQPIDTSALAEWERGANVGWHPDARRISFLLSFRSRAPIDVATIQVATGAMQRSNVAPSVQQSIRELGLSVPRPDTLVWSPDGTAIYFVGFVRGVRNVWSLDVDRQTLAITGGPHAVTSLSQSVKGIALSPAGRQLAFGMTNLNSQLVSYSLDGSGTQLTGSPEMLTLPTLHAFSPDLSRDGSRLVYRRRHLASGFGQIEMQIIGDGQERTLLIDEFLARRESRTVPRWSPDGSSIVYRHIRQEQILAPSQRITNASLVLLDPKTGNERPLTSPFPDGRKFVEENAYGWSPNGEQVISTSGRYLNDQMVIALLPVAAAPTAESKATIVTEGGEYRLWNSVMSRTGWICFQAESNGKSRLVAIRSTGGRWEWLTDGRAWVGQPRWSSDGRLIYFMSDAGGLLNVWGLSFDPTRGTPIGEPFQITHFDGSAEYMESTIEMPGMAVADGRLVVSVVQPPGGIQLLEKR